MLWRRASVAIPISLPNAVRGRTMNSDEISVEIAEPRTNDEIAAKLEIAADSADTDAAQSAPLALGKVILLAITVTAFLASLYLNIATLLGDASGNLDGSFSWVVTASALLITAISLGVSFWLYYVRSILLKDGPALVPEKWGVYLAKLGHVVSNTNARTAGSLSNLIAASAHQTEKSDAVLDSFLTLQEVISSRDNEIQRLKKGQDTKIFKRFLARFIRVSTELKKIQLNSQGSEQEKDYEYLCRLMEAALAECGLEPWSPEEGSDYRELGAEVADDPAHVLTDDPAKDFKVASIDSPAYIVEGQGDREIIVQAKVTIFQFKDQ